MPEISPTQQPIRACLCSELPSAREFERNAPVFGYMLIFVHGLRESDSIHAAREAVAELGLRKAAWSDPSAATPQAVAAPATASSAQEPHTKPKQGMLTTVRSRRRTRSALSSIAVTTHHVVHGDAELGGGTLRQRVRKVAFGPFDLAPCGRRDTNASGKFDLGQLREHPEVGQRPVWLGDRDEIGHGHTQRGDDRSQRLHLRSAISVLPRVNGGCADAADPVQITNGHIRPLASGAKRSRIEPALNSSAHSWSPVTVGHGPQHTDQESQGGVEIGGFIE